ncbi:MAG: DUF502 domain-containing protein [Longimicrobiales bacterium]
MKRAAWRIRSRMTSGVVALVPLVVTVYVLRALFGLTAGILLPLIDPAVEHWPWLLRAVLSLTVLLVGIYLLGELAHNLVGRRVLQLGEEILLRVPFVKVIYRASKQVVTAFQKPNSAAFKSVVLVEFPRKGLHSVGFLTNTFTQADGTVWHSVFVPTTPNPTTGFLEFLPAEDVIHTDLTVEDAFKLVMSLGVLTPERMGDLLAGRGKA